MKEYSAAEWQEILKKTQGTYKYTQLTDKFVRKVFGSKNECYRFLMENAECMQEKTISPTKDFKAILMVGNEYYILANDFEITTLDGFVEPHLTKTWREGMIKRALPLQDKKFYLDARHYLTELHIFENKKVADNVSVLYNMLIAREIEEQDQ